MWVLSETEHPREHGDFHVYKMFVRKSRLIRSRIPGSESKIARDWRKTKDSIFVLVAQQILTGRASET